MNASKLREVGSALEFAATTRPGEPLKEFDALEVGRMLLWAAAQIEAIPK